MAVSKQDEFTILDRRRQVADLYLRGTPQYLIARQFNVHKGQITRDLQAIREDWKRAAALDFGERLAQELAKVDRLELEYWTAWDRSCKDAQVLLAETIKTADGSRAKTSKRVEGQAGDPRFLTGIQWCSEQRCKLLGLIKTKLEHSGPGGEAIPVRVIEFTGPSEATDARPSDTEP